MKRPHPIGYVQNTTSIQRRQLFAPTPTADEFNFTYVLGFFGFWLFFLMGKGGWSQKVWITRKVTWGQG